MNLPQVIQQLTYLQQLLESAGRDCETVNVLFADKIIKSIGLEGNDI